MLELEVVKYIDIHQFSQWLPLYNEQKDRPSKGLSNRVKHKETGDQMNCTGQDSFWQRVFDFNYLILPGWALKPVHRWAQINTDVSCSHSCRSSSTMNLISHQGWAWTQNRKEWKKPVAGLFRVVCVFRGQTSCLSSVFIGVHLWTVVFINVFLYKFVNVQADDYNEGRLWSNPTLSVR
jgi:hypothetical protein